MSLGGAQAARPARARDEAARTYVGTFFGALLISSMSFAAFSRIDTPNRETSGLLHLPRGRFAVK
jgi:hypothetical protein